MLIWDDDHWYMGPALALRLRALGRAVTIATPLGRIGAWGRHTEEQGRTMAAIIGAGIGWHTNRVLARIGSGRAVLGCVFGGSALEIDAATVIPVTARLPGDGLWQALAARPEALRGAGVSVLRRIGDCEAPGSVAAAVWSGHRAPAYLEAPERAVAGDARREMAPPAHRRAAAAE